MKNKINSALIVIPGAVVPIFTLVHLIRMLVNESTNAFPIVYLLAILIFGIVTVASLILYNVFTKKEE